MMTRKERFERALRHGEVDRLLFRVKILGRWYVVLQPERRHALTWDAVA